MPLFRKKPVVIEARQLTDDLRNHTQIADWIGEAASTPPGHPCIYIDTLEGQMRANVGDWVIRGVNGEYYPCKPDIFEATYEQVAETHEQDAEDYPRPSDGVTEQTLTRPQCWHVAIAGPPLTDKIAEAHLTVRRLQVDDKTGAFADLYDSQDDLTNIHGYYIQPGGGFWVALDGRDPVGFVGLRVTAPGVGELKRFAVLPEWRGRGIGTELVGLLADYADRQGFREVNLSTGFGETALGIYKAAGWRHVGVDLVNEDHLMRRARAGGNW